MDSLLEKLRSGLPLQLVVIAGDELAEVMIIDGELNLVARDIGDLHVNIPGGVYKVKQRLGDHISERVIFLKEDGQREDFPPLEIGSAIPIFHQEIITESSQEPEFATSTLNNTELKFNPEKWKNLCLIPQSSNTVGEGVGSEISFFFRIDLKSKADDNLTQSPPVVSYDLLDEGGDSVLGGPIEISNNDLDEGCYSLTARVAPGPHYLTLYTSGENVLQRMATQQTVYASENWQTRVYGFLLQIEPDADSICQVDANRISINMAAIGVAPTQRNMRLIETARQALISGQYVDFLDRKSMLIEKFNDPILGLFAAHIILEHEFTKLKNESDIDPEDLEIPSVIHTISNNLKGLLSSDNDQYALHPDIAALLLIVGENVENLRVVHPPMLLNSWHVLVNSSLYVEHDLIEIDSDVEKISTHVVSNRPWMRWEAPKAASKTGRLFNTAKRSLSGLLWEDQLEILPETFGKASQVSSQEQFMFAIADAVLTVKSSTELDYLKNITSDATERFEKAQSIISNSSLDDKQLLRQLGRKLRLPRNQIKKMLKEFNSSSGDF